MAFLLVATSLVTSGAYAANPGSAGACAIPPLKRCDPPLVNPGFGPTQASPTVYVIFWGPDWDTININSDEVQVESAVTGFFQSTSVAATNYFAILDQYLGAGKGAPVFGGSWIDVGKPPNPVLPKDAQPEIDNAIGNNPLWKAGGNTQFVIVPQVGSHVMLKVGEEKPPFCAYHFFATSPVNGSEIFDMDPVSAKGTGFAAVGCATHYGKLAGSGFPSVLAAMTTGLSHEYAEAATDPYVDAWKDQSGANNKEIGDLCAHPGTLLPGFTYVQDQWSNADTGVTTILERDAPAGIFSIVTNAILPRHSYLSIGTGPTRELVHVSGFAKSNRFRAFLTKNLLVTHSEGDAVVVLGGCVNS